jgi:hypothetical protein
VKQLTSPDLAGAPENVDQSCKHQDTDRHVDHLGAGGLPVHGAVDEALAVVGVEVVLRLILLGPTAGLPPLGLAAL